MSVLGLALSTIPPERVDAVLRAALARGLTWVELGHHGESVCRLAGKLIRSAEKAVFVTVGLAPEQYRPDFDLKRWLKERAGWLGVRAVDGLDFSGLDRETWPRLKGSSLLEAARKSGLVQHLGFSFYDQALYLRPVLKEFNDWAFCRVQASFMDADRLPGAEGLISAAAAAGLAVVAAEPLLDGRLLSSIPETVAALWEDRSPLEFALRWAWHEGRAATAAVTLRSPEEVEAAADVADGAVTDLSVREQILVSRVRDAYRTLRPVPCTTCRACMPCPQGIDAPRIFELYNDAVMYGDRAYARAAFAREGHDVSRCDGCGACARRCGRHIDITVRVREAADYLASQDEKDSP